MDNTTHTNGKSTLVHVTHQTLPAPPERTCPGMTPAHPRYSRVLDLVRDAVDLDLRLKATMDELDREMREVGSGDLPSVLVSLMKHHQQVVPAAPRPGPVKAKPREPVKSEPAARNRRNRKNMGGALKARILGLMSDKKERRSKQIVKGLKAKNSTSVYSLLSDLVEEGHLIRTRYAHYRLKLRA